jgi:TrmH family RNA methyltransferase
MFMKITSRQNVWFKRVRDAIRDHAGEIVIEGPKAVDDALAAGWSAIALFWTAAAQPLFSRALDQKAAAAPPQSIEFSATLFDSLSETKTNQGVIALFERPKPANIFARRDSIVVALDGVQDPGNVGTIVRLAAAFDASGVALLPGCADPFSPKSIRASAGAILSVPVAQVTIAELLNCGLPLFAADGSASTIAPPARAAVLILGSEGAGVSDELLRASTRIAIATSGRVESLNVATAAAILMSKSFEAR